MNNQDKNSIFDDERDDNEIAEYLERDLSEIRSRTGDREGRRMGRSSSVRGAKTAGARGKRVIADDGKSSYSARPASDTGEYRKSGNRQKPRLVQYYENNKMQVLWSALGVLVIILIIALIVTNVGGGGDKEDETPNITENTATEPATDETTEQPTEKENEFLAEPSDSAYNRLFEKFFQNTYVEWNETAVAECYESMQNVTGTNYSYLNKYIEAVQDIVCYVGYETEDGKKLVYVTYSIKFQNINTVAPMMDAYLLVSEGDEYRIHNFEVGEELDLYTNSVQDNPHYQELKSNINNQRDNALASDEDLKKVYDALQGIGGEG